MRRSRILDMLVIRLEKYSNQIIDKLNHVEIRINEEITHDKFARDPIKGRQTGKQRHSGNTHSCLRNWCFSASWAP